MPRNETVLIEDAHIVFRNFSGKEGMYNKAGDRNFAVLLDADTAAELSSNGWNVKQLRPREEGDEPQPYIAVTVGYKGRPPTIKMIGATRTTELDESTVDTLDFVEIARVDLIFRPYDWDVNGATGRKAYLQDLYVTIIENPLELKYGNTNVIATVDGPMAEHTDPLGS